MKYLVVQKLSFGVINIFICRVVFQILVLGSIEQNAYAQEIRLNEIMPSNSITIYDFDGESSDWIELYNFGNEDINLNGYYLSDKNEDLMKWEFPDIQLHEDEYLLIFASGKNKIISNEIHTNFKISNSDGEQIILTKPDGQSIIDISPNLFSRADISMGIKPDSKKLWYYFEVPTPGEQNNSTAYSDIASHPILSYYSGFYEENVALEVFPENVNDVIYYSVDGTIPTEESDVYINPLTLYKTTSLRFLVKRANAIPSTIMTQTYFIDEQYDFDVISLVTSPENLDGHSSDTTCLRLKEEWPIHIEYFKSNGPKMFALDAGAKYHGYRKRPQASIRLYARSEYGTNIINHNIFNLNGINRYKRLILRNGGNDGAQLKRTHIRDVFVHNLFKKIDTNYAVSAHLHVHVFINGNYWGIYNLRERQDQYYIREHYGYETDEIDFLEYDFYKTDFRNTIAGDWNDFDNLKSFVINNELNDESNYLIVQDWIDIENFIDYQIIQIFIGNQDWCNNNVKFWRPKEEGFKWKWVLWDTEYGLGTYRNDTIGNPGYDFVNFALSHGGWGNGDHTWLLRNLAENINFRNKFVLRFQDLLNTAFHHTYTNQLFDEMVSVIEPEIDKQINRWGSSLEDWYDDIDYAKYFMSERPDYIRQHLSANFDLNSDTHSVELNVSSQSQGKIRINSILIDEFFPGIDLEPYPWSGKYFSDIPIQLEAIPNEGYWFSHWDGLIVSDENPINVNLASDTSIMAVFLPDGENYLNDSKNLFRVFPVPSRNRITILFAEDVKVVSKLYITNSMGVIIDCIEVDHIKDDSINYNISSLFSGVYFVVLETGGGQALVKKFIVY